MLHRQFIDQKATLPLKKNKFINNDKNSCMLFLFIY